MSDEKTTAAVLRTDAGDGDGADMIALAREGGDVADEVLRKRLVLEEAPGDGNIWMRGREKRHLTARWR